MSSAARSRSIRTMASFHSSWKNGVRSFNNSLCIQSTVTQPLDGVRDCGIEDLDRNSRLFCRNDQRRAKAQRALTAAQKQQTFFKTLPHDPITQFSIRRTAAVGALEVDANHEPQAAHITDDGMAAPKSAEQ